MRSSLSSSLATAKRSVSSGTAAEASHMPVYSKAMAAWWGDTLQAASTTKEINGRYDMPWLRFVVGPPQKTNVLQVGPLAIVAALADVVVFRPLREIPPVRGVADLIYR